MSITFDQDGEPANDYNNQLSSEALTANGLTGVGADFVDPGLGDFTMLWSGAADSKLNGLQSVLDGSIFERGRFALDGNVRAGVFLNQARGTIVEQYSPSGGSVYI